MAFAISTQYRKCGAVYDRFDCTEAPLAPFRNVNTAVRSPFLLLVLFYFALAPIAAAGSTREHWPDYQIIIWQPQTSARLAGLARLGVTAGKIFGQRDRIDRAKISEEIAPFQTLRLRAYIENIATDFYAPYHRWQPGYPVNRLFNEVQELHRREPTNMAAFLRTPSLSDREWLSRISLRLGQNVRAFASFHPLYYSLADEAGIADLGAAWDFDFGHESLAGMRTWLRQRYGALAALNLEWGTAFSNWNAVRPMTTDDALQRSDENFSAWADFKEWMDVAFARAVRAGTDAVHAADPTARAALEGAQIPGWGGYDYRRLGDAVDVIEMYDSGNNTEIAHSLFPKLILLMTAFGLDPEQVHRIWHQLLLGGRGVILWDEDNGLVDDDGAPTDRGRVLSALARELRSGLAAQLIASSAAIDPVAVLYSPESFRTQWLLDRKGDSKPWAERRSETEAEDNAVRATTRRVAGMLAHLGVQPRWLTAPMIEQGILPKPAPIRVLMLPPRDRHCRRGRPSGSGAFAKAGGVVLADSQPGVFDAHSRRLAAPRLVGSVTLMPELERDTALGDPSGLIRLRRVLEQAGITLPFRLSTPEGGVATDVDARIFRNGTTTLIGLQRDWTTDDPQIARDVVVNFKSPVYVRNLRVPGAPRQVDHIALKLDAVTPALIAIAPLVLPLVSIAGPPHVRLGAVATFTIAAGPVQPADGRVIHIEAIAPDGSAVPEYTTNLSIHGGPGIWRLTLASNEPTGTWTIRINDVLGGQRLERAITAVANP